MDNSKFVFGLIVSVLILAVTIAACSLVGSQQISLRKALQGPGPTEPNIDYQILFEIRLPRVVLAALVGAALACAGAVLQAILRNPLAEPFILGISSGAGVGVILAVITGISWTWCGGSPVSMFAFTGAMLTICLVWLIGHLAGRSQTTHLLLAGVVVNAFLSAVMMFLTSIAKSEHFYTTVFWLMGNITQKNTPVLLSSAIFIILFIIVLTMLGKKLNVLSLGDFDAKSLGINPARLRFTAFVLSAFVTAIAVSLSGLIGFVGLIIPHAVRFVTGPDNRKLLPVCAMIGAAFLILADTIARTIIAPSQLPVGIITALLGGPFFLLMLARYSKNLNRVK